MILVIFKGLTAASKSQIDEKMQMSNAKFKGDVKVVIKTPHKSIATEVSGLQK